MEPPYDTWILVYKNDVINGYLHTFREAEDFCKKNHEYSWEYAKSVVKNKVKRDKLYQKLNMVIL